VGNKTELRKQLRRLRSSLNVQQQQLASKNLLTQLITLAEFTDAEKIAMYLAHDGEIDLAEIIRWSWRNSKHCYVPIVVHQEEKTLVFAEIDEHTEFVRNRFNIPEPVVNEEKTIAANELDLVLLPLVGYDLQGNRIGMGGGFYDITFKFIKSMPNGRPKLMGMAHERQKIDAISAESWDIPLYMVVTDECIYRTKRT